MGNEILMKKLTTLCTVLAISVALPLFAADKKTDNAELKVITGEIIDITCYVDHGASGEKHASCAAHCISSGLPVGIKAADGTIYTVVGEHKPLNKELAEYGGKVVTLRGKPVSRDGLNLLENAELVK